MTCKIQASLNEAWSQAAGEFSTVTEAMTGDQVGKMSTADFVALRARAEDARLASGNAWTLLELHRQEHGC
jgi:hypothetical protein